ncbi:hypothetical protein KEM55_008879 [Ascosphaera atra]|nr:hypothetical protein KEM55_008879 [Ascosphaera atra]
MARLDDMATRIVAAWYQFGQDNWPVHDRASYSSARFTAWNGSSSNPYPDVNARGNHNRIIRRIGAEGTVLLKNDRHFLPLPYPNDTLWANLAGKNGTFRIGVFGTAAGSGKGNGSMVNPATVTPWEALKDAFVNQTAVKISPFLSDVATSDEDLATQDLCLVFASTASGYSGDRNTIMLQNDTEKLIHEVAGKCGGKGEKGDTVVVMYSVGPVIVESFIEHSKVRSVLLAHLPGEEGGHALTDVLFGLKEPSGRLPYTIGKTLADYGPDAQVLSETKDAAAPQKDFSAAGRYIDYRYFDSHNVTPRFEFGYGLSYTRFDLSALQLMPLRPLREVPDPPPRQGNATTTSSALRFMEMSNNPATSNVNMNPHLALAPKKFHKTKGHVYPYMGANF